MTPIHVMINGLPGNVTRIITEAILEDSRFSLIPCSLTGPEITEREIFVNNTPIALVLPSDHERALEKLKKDVGNFIIADYTHPSAVNQNAELYCKLKIPFVMGTTGGNRKKLTETVQNANIPAVIAPNMAKQIVALQAMMEFGGQNFPGVFSGYTMSVVESHQAAKADTSGTAKAVVYSFNQMGVDFTEEDIQLIRDPKEQLQMGIPEDVLGGHAWHTYTLTSPDKTTQFSFTHNVNGRKIYGGGTKDAIITLATKIAQGEPPKIYSMIDILKNG